jgi:hypothetical protein
MLRSRLYTFALVAAAAASLLLVAGCEDDSDDFEHTPAAGLGALVIHNETTDDMTVFIDGGGTNEVEAWESAAYDLSPGLHRVVLDQENGDRTYRDDVDILLGRLTELKVRYRPDDLDHYEGTVTFED